MRFDLKRIIIKKYRNRQLGHFYIIKSNPNVANPPAFLKDWINSLLEEICLPPDTTSPATNPDILSIEPDSSASQYQVAEFSDFFDFVNYRPLKLSRKMVIIHDAHKIGPVIANKLLKTLESPANPTTVFLINPFNSNLLPTINSRAISLTVNNFEMESALSPDFHPIEGRREITGWLGRNKDNFELPCELYQALCQYIDGKAGESKIIDLLKSNSTAQDALLSLMTNLQQSLVTNYQQKKAFLEHIRWFQQAKAFHNSPGERFFALLRTTFKI